MGESNNNQNDQSTEEQQPSDETQTDLREISEEELKKILEDHKKWLESDGKEGERADLIGTDLQSANLSGASLQRANLHQASLQNATLSEIDLKKANLHNVDLHKAFLTRADLVNANLFEANLQNAKLYYANLQSSNLTRADMRNTTLDGVQGLSEAELQYANLEGATGLLGDEIAQADLTGTKLPKNIEKFKALDIVEKTSQNARKIFFAMLLGCVYSWLTIATTTDVRLLTNTASSPLPIIGTEIPIAWFYIAAPLVLIALYLYFHFYLQGLWESLAGLPAIFPDGKRLDERAYPWLLNRLVRRYFKRLRTGRPIIAHLQEYVVIILAWFVVPFTMIGFWLRFIPRHDWIGTCLHIGLIVVSIAFAIIFYGLCASTLQGKKKNVFRFQYFWSDKSFYYATSIVVVGILFSLISYGAINGHRGITNWSEKEKKYVLEIEGIKGFIPWAFENIGYDVFADFREKDVSEKPTKWTGEEINLVKGARLQGMDLRYAKGEGAFLVKADFVRIGDYLGSDLLMGADLMGADLTRADLRNANLKTADLEGANLVFANLEETDLLGANLTRANLTRANLTSANLTSADLTSADLMGTDLRFAKLIRAKLMGAVLNGAKLMEAVLIGADLREANLDMTVFYPANLGPAYLRRANMEETALWGVRFERTELKRAKLMGADLTEALLMGADLTEAFLMGTNLEGANLGPAYPRRINLEEANLEEAALRGVRLERTELSRADLRNANLKEADLEEIDLRGAKNLRVEQLCEAKTLYKAILDYELKKQIKEKCPHLLEKSKDGE